MEPSGLGRSLIYAITEMRRRGDLESEGGLITVLAQKGDREGGEQGGGGCKEVPKYSVLHWQHFSNGQCNVEEERRTPPTGSGAKTKPVSLVVAC